MGNIKKALSLVTLVLAAISMVVVIALVVFGYSIGYNVLATGFRDTVVYTVIGTYTGVQLNQLLVASVFSAIGFSFITLGLFFLVAADKEYLFKGVEMRASARVADLEELMK